MRFGWDWPGAPAPPILVVAVSLRIARRAFAERVIAEWMRFYSYLLRTRCGRMRAGRSAWREADGVTSCTAARGTVGVGCPAPGARLAGGDARPAVVFQGGCSRHGWRCRFDAKTRTRAGLRASSAGRRSGRPQAVGASRRSPPLTPASRPAVYRNSTARCRPESSHRNTYPGGVRRAARGSPAGRPGERKRQGA